MRRDKQRPAPQSLTVLFEGSFLRLQFSDIIPWAELLQLDCYWALVQLRSCKSQPRRNRGQSRTGHLFWTPLTSCILFPVYESLTRTFYLFLMHLLSIIIVATVIHPCKKMLPCLNMTRRSCVTGQEVGDYLPVSTMATEECAGFGPSAGTAEESSVSLPIC